MVVAGIFWLDRDNLRDSADGEVGFADVLYFTAVTVTTVGYGDIVPVGTRARLIDAFVVTPIRFVIWLIFLGTAYQLLFQRFYEAHRMRRLHDGLNGHTVVLGYGYEGRMAAAELLARAGDKAKPIVVVDIDPAAVERAATAGLIGLQGDATDADVLDDARIDSAAAALVCTPRDDTTVLCVLRLRKSNPALRIIASVRQERNHALCLQAGADVAVAPAKLAGSLMADAVSSRHITPFISDLISSRGVIDLFERPALAAEVGKRMDQLDGLLVVALERDGRVLGFWDQPEARIERGDLVFGLAGRKRV